MAERKGGEAVTNPIAALKDALNTVCLGPDCKAKWCTDARVALGQVEAVYAQLEALEAENERLRKHMAAAYDALDEVPTLIEMATAALGPNAPLGDAYDD